MKSGCFCRYGTPRGSALIAAVLPYQQKILGALLLTTLVSLLAFAAPSALNNLTQPDAGPEMVPPTAELWKTEMQVTPREISVWYDAVLHRPGLNAQEPLTFSTRGNSLFASVSPLSVQLDGATPYTNFYPHAQMFGDLLLLQVLPILTRDDLLALEPQPRMSETVQLYFTLTPIDAESGGATTRYLPVLPAGVTTIGTLHASLVFSAIPREELGGFQIRNIHGGVATFSAGLTTEWEKEGNDTRLVIRSRGPIAAYEGLALQFAPSQRGGQ